MTDYDGMRIGEVPSTRDLGKIEECADDNLLRLPWSENKEKKP